MDVFAYGESESDPNFSFYTVKRNYNFKKEVSKGINDILLILSFVHRFVSKGLARIQHLVLEKFPPHSARMERRTQNSSLSIQREMVQIKGEASDFKVYMNRTLNSPPYTSHLKSAVGKL